MKKLFMVFRTTTGKRGTDPAVVVMQMFNSRDAAAAYLLGIWDVRDSFKSRTKTATFDGSHRPYLVQFGKVKYTIGEYDTMFGVEFQLAW